MLMPNNPCLNLTMGDFINSFPGYAGLVDLESKFILGNKVGSKWLGYKSPEHMIGDAYENMPCNACEDYRRFLEQDKITQNRDHLRFVGYYCYADDNWKIILGEKFMIKNSEKQNVALMCHFSEYTNANLLDISRFLLDPENNLGYKKKQFSFIIEDVSHSTLFSKRELECLFFMLRAKTAKFISKKLGLSPRTIEKYIDNMKIKQNCHSKSELIEKLITLGYLNYIPNSLIDINMN